MLGASAGRRLGRYTLYGELASGGLGTVHLATSSAAGGFRKIVAIKRLHTEFRKDRSFSRLFLDEARLSARIAHANVVQTLDAIETDDEVLLVMEYVHGEALHRLFDEAIRAGKPIPVPIAVAIVSGVLRGLAAAHDARDEEGRLLGLVHRDVSPQNIMVGVDGIARLLDFGIARPAGQSRVTKEGHVKGKLGYMAPEQFEGATLSQQADLYACGVVLWELLTAKRLFTGETEAIAISRVVSYTVPPPSDLRDGISTSLNRVVLRALARNPSLRFASAAEMARELEAASPPASAASVGAWLEELAAEQLRARAAACVACERAEAVRPLSRRPGSVFAAFGAFAIALVSTALVVARRERTTTTTSTPIAPIHSSTAESASVTVQDAPPVSKDAGEAIPMSPGPVIAGTKPPVVRASRPAALPSTSSVPKENCTPPYFVDSSGRKQFKRQCL